jgi:CNT family concentrative nucleoside transporter
MVLQVPKGYSQENLILGLIYAWTTLYFFFCFVPTTVVSTPWNKFWYIVSRPVMRLSLKWRKILYPCFSLAVIVITIFSLPESVDSTRIRRLIALFGMVMFLFLVFCTSNVSGVVWWFHCCIYTSILTGSHANFFFF